MQIVTDINAATGDRMATAECISVERWVSYYTCLISLDNWSILSHNCPQERNRY